MNHALRLTFLAFLALTFTGYGKRVPVPGKTIVAAYVDLEKAYENGKRVCDTFIDALPAEERSDTRGKYEEALKNIDKVRDVFHAQWAVITFGGTLKALSLNHPGENVAVTMKVKTDEDAIKRWLKKDFYFLDFKTRTRNGNVIFEIEGEERLALIDNAYLVFGFSSDAFEDMLDVCNGDVKPSAEFDDLAEISDDTVCRISTAPVSTLLRRFEVERYVEKFGEASTDEEMADMILNMGSISLDIEAGKNVGLTLRVKCGSTSDAKLLESVAQSAAFFARLGCDTGAFFADNPDILDAMRMSSREQEGFRAAKRAFLALARSVVANRYGSTVELSISAETKSVARAIEAYSEYEANKWKKRSEYYGAQTNSAVTVGYKPSSYERARALIRDVDNALTRYYSRYDEYPYSLDDLTRKGLLQGGTYDPWGTRLRYERMGSYRRPKVTSAGPDREFGTYDDISNMESYKVEKKAADKAKDEPKKGEAYKATDKKSDDRSYEKKDEAKKDDAKKSYDAKKDLK